MDGSETVTITGLTPQKKAGRLNIFVDGAFYSGISELSARVFRLHAGLIIPKAKLTEALLHSDSAAAFDYALKLVSLRLRSEAEIARKLKEKTYAPEIIGSVTEKLKTYNYLSDESFAKAYVASAKKRAGGRKLLGALRQKGVDSETAAAAVEELGGQEAEAAALAAKYMRSKECTREVFLKLIKHLLQKGFSYAESRAAAESVFAGTGADTEITESGE